MSELWQLSATELLGLMETREVSSQEAVTAHLERIAEVNPTLNALTCVLHDSALDRARRIDAARHRGEAVGTLGGLPISIKDNQDVAGSATTLGLKPLAGALAGANSPHIDELLAAGAIPIARSSMPEFGMRWHTSNALIGATLNPWDHGRTPGGSSGGEATAIASGMSPLGIGNDGAGSLRWPAQCCGIAALKPSHGRVPIASSGSAAQPIPFAFQLLGVHGPMARRVADLRLAFQHMCGNGSRDPWHTRAPFEGAVLSQPLRVGVVRAPGGNTPHPGIQRALEEAAGHLEAQGYRVEDAELPDLERASEIYTQIMSSFGRLTAEAERAPVGLISEEFDQFWAAFAEPWEQAAGVATHDPMMERGVIAHRWAQLQETTPLLLAPIATQPTWPVGSDLREAFNAQWLEDIRSVVAINLLGLPAVALPITCHDGLPQGVQIVGPRFREDLCLQAAEAIEACVTPLVPPG